MSVLQYVLSHQGELALYLGLLLVSYKTIIYIQRIFFHPLSNVPGPTICAASRLYEFYWDSWQHGRLWSRLPDLHRKYGPIVRIGPNEVHIHDLDYFDELMSFRPLNKEAMTAKQFMFTEPLFGTEDHKAHARKRAAFGDIYSRSTVLQLVGLVNERVDKGCDWLKTRVKDGGVADLAMLFRSVPGDIITTYLYGAPYGYLEDEKTTKAAYDKRFDLLFGFANLGRFIPSIIPILMSLVKMLVKSMIGMEEPGTSFMSMMKFSSNNTKKVIEEYNNPTGKSLDRQFPDAWHSFLSSDLPAEWKELSKASQHAQGMWSGGTDSIGQILTVGTWFILQNPNIQKRLEEELRDAWTDPTEHPEGDLAHLPYLDAVIQESLRLSPGAQCRLQRYNPTSVETYGKYTFPPGTFISVSLPMVLSDPELWGKDPEVFRPERWMEGDIKRKMHYSVSFSKGARVCHGKELALTEMRIIFGALFRKFQGLKLAERVGGEEILPYYDGFVPAPKTRMHRLPVMADGYSG